MSQVNDPKTHENIQARNIRDRMLKLMYPIIHEKMHNKGTKANSAMFSAGTLKRLAQKEQEPKTNPELEEELSL
ncbi:MAG: hypothetical protein IJV31_10750 [Clostridia bacterium]|nr:hypothetical protein [Clostridia bacterium]